MEGYDYNTVCRYDYLEIYDGPSTNPYKKARLCGSGSYELISTANSLYLEFRSNGHRGYRGFQFTYSLIGIHHDSNFVNYINIEALKMSSKQNQIIDSLQETFNWKQQNFLQLRLQSHQPKVLSPNYYVQEDWKSK